jgi:hypothetical protein
MRSTHTTTWVTVCALLLAIVAAWTTVRETRSQHKSPFGDFAYLQTGAECLVDACDPYDYAALTREAQARHEAKPAIWPQSPVYPPSSLLLLLPFQGLGWPTAAYAFDALAGLATLVACVLAAWLLRLQPWHPVAVILIAVLVCQPMSDALEFGNPALLSAALVTMACLLLLETQFTTAGWIALGGALALKPQLAAGALALLLWRRETRAAAARAAGLAVVLLVAGALAYRVRLGSFHYLATLRWVLWLTSLPAATSDFANDEAFDFLNIQSTLYALTHAPHAIVNAMGWLVTFSLAAAAGWLGHLRGAARRLPWTMIALLTTISLLPVYHRGYDRVIALALAPAAVELAICSKRLAWGYAAVVVFWLANNTVMAHGMKRWHLKPQNPVEELIFCGILLWSLWHASHAAEPRILVAS